MELSENAVQVAKPSLRQIPDKENFKRQDEIIGPNKVRSTFAIRQAEGEPRYEKSVTFDFTNCTREEIALLSLTNGCVVWAQRVLRDMGEGMLNAANLAHVDVKEDIIEAPARIAVDPVERARRAVSRLPQEERLALLEQLMGNSG